MEPPPRHARLVLVTPHGTVVGTWPPLPIETPWWQDIGPVVRAARAAHGVDVTVLRVLDAEQAAATGAITYLAEVAEPVAADPWNGALDEQPLRLGYARLGGPAADVAWAQGALQTRGYVLAGAAEQVRTWNLSSLWRIPIEGQTAWLKVVPPFFAHEGTVLEALDGERVPRLIAHDGPRMLMAEIPGEDLYAASLEQRLAMVRLLTDLQRRWIDREGDLAALGLPDWRAGPLTASIARVLERTADQLSDEQRTALAAFVADLPRRFANLAECGLPDTLVHGDFHPGNLRGVGEDLTLLDWGDCGFGHPLLDQSAFLERADAAMAAQLQSAWHAVWRVAVPGCDPDRASALVAPISAARRAVVYQAFLDNIEPAEHPYHRTDPADWLAATAELLVGRR